MGAPCHWSEHVYFVSGLPWIDGDGMWHQIYVCSDCGEPYEDVEDQ